MTRTLWGRGMTARGARPEWLEHREVDDSLRVVKNDGTGQLAFQCLMRFTDCAATESKGHDCSNVACFWVAIAWKNNEWPPRPVLHKLGRLCTHSFLFRFRCKSPFYTSNGNKCINGVTVRTTALSSGGRGFNPSTVLILLRVICRFRVEDGQNWLRNVSRRKGREAAVVPFMYRWLEDSSTVCSVHRKRAELHFLYKGCQPMGWAIFTFSKKNLMELNSGFSNWASISTFNLSP